MSPPVIMHYVINRIITQHSLEQFGPSQSRMILAITSFIIHYLGWQVARMFLGRLSNWPFPVKLTGCEFAGNTSHNAVCGQQAFRASFLSAIRTSRRKTLYHIAMAI
jgi:hypothetical protein